MRKRNIDVKRNSIKLIGTALFMSLVLSANVHAEEDEKVVNSEDITAISDGIDTLSDQVDELKDNNTDEGLADDISTISEGVDTLDDQLDYFLNGILDTVNKFKVGVIKGLNKSVYAQDNISEDASLEDVLSKIDDIKYNGTVDIKIESKDTYTLESGYYDGGKIDVSAIYEAARKEGYEAGKADGYQVGLKAGKDEGYKSGRNDGYQAGVNDGRNSGWNEGRNSGWNDGYAAGLRNGDVKHHIEVQTDYMGNSHVQMWIEIDGREVGYSKDGGGNCHWAGDY